MNNAAARRFRRILGAGRLVKWLISIARYIFIAGICYIILNPILTKISMSLMSPKDLYDKTVRVIPKNVRWSNFIEVYGFLNFGDALFNSAWLSVLVGLLQTFICTAVGYGFAKFRFKWRNVLFICVVASMVIPPQITITPLYLNLKSFSLFGLITPYRFSLIGNPAVFILLGITATAPKCGLYIFLARQFFKGVPREIEEAASIDGAGPFRTYFSLMLKTAVPIMVTIFLFSFVWQYNDTMFTSMFYTELNTLAKSLLNLGYQLVTINIEGGSKGANFGYLSIMNASATLLAIVPLLVIYLFFQRYFIQSIERSGLVG